MKNFKFFPTLAMTISAFFLFTLTTSAQEVKLGPANQLSDFVISNADSVKTEGDAKTYYLTYPEKAWTAQVSVVSGKKVTLEVSSDILSKDYQMWCLLFDAQSGNIYDNLYVCKFLPTNAKNKAAEFDRIISDLNSVTLKTLQAQKAKLKAEAAERKKLQEEIAKWADKKRSYDAYSAIDEDPFWAVNKIMLNWKGDMTTEPETPGGVELFYNCELDCENDLNLLRKVAAKIKTLK